MNCHPSDRTRLFSFAQGVIAALALCAVFIMAPLAGAEPAEHRIGLATGTLIFPESLSPDDDNRIHVLMTLHCFERGVQEFHEWGAPHWALVAVHNPGFSSVYRRLFERPQLFLELLQETRRHLQEHTSDEAVQPGTVWIAAFSAGYAGIREILADEACYEAVDGIMLLDCPHTGYTDEQKVVPRQMQHFLRFARDAVAGDKRFLMTHSEIVPGSYASTTECADYLLEHLGLDRAPMSGRNSEDMQALTRAGEGQFRIYGFAGDQAPHHMQHLYSLDQWLRDDWRWTLDEPVE